MSRPGEREYVRAVALLQERQLVYLATPYTLYPDGLDSAARAAAVIAARLIQDGVRLFAPIPHSHAIAAAGGLDARDHKLWLAQCAPLMDACDCLAVARMDGWRESYGVRHEIAFFEAAAKPVHYLPVDWLTRSAQ